MNIVVLLLLVLALVLFLMASSDGDSKKGYIGLALCTLSAILWLFVTLTLR